MSPARRFDKCMKSTATVNAINQNSEKKPKLAYTLAFALYRRSSLTQVRARFWTLAISPTASSRLLAVAPSLPFLGLAQYKPDARVLKLHQPGFSLEMVTRRVSEAEWQYRFLLADASGYQKRATSKRASECVFSLQEDSHAAPDHFRWLLKKQTPCRRHAFGPPQLFSMKRRGICEYE